MSDNSGFCQVESQAEGGKPARLRLKTYAHAIREKSVLMEHVGES